MSPGLDVTERDTVPAFGDVSCHDSEMADASMECLQGDVWKFVDDIGMHLVRTYYDQASGFSGSRFDRFAGGGDSLEHRNEFTSEDLVAVTLLEMTVPGDASLALLERDPATFNQLLSDVPVDVDLWDASDQIVGPASSAAILWSRLMDFPGMGWVTTSKLLARKRPRLLPVYDTVVQAALQPESDRFWIPLRNELQDERFRERLREMRDQADVDDRVALLRILDVAIWMRNRRASTCKLEFTPRRPTS